MKVRKLLIAGLIVTQIIGVSACGKSSSIEESSVSETTEETLETQSETQKETYIDDSGKKIEKANEDDGPHASYNKPLYETVGNAIEDSINEAEIIRDSMKQNTSERQAEETEQQTEDVKQEQYEFNGSTVTLEYETLPGVIEVYDPAVSKSVFEDVIRFGQVYLQINSSINDIGYTIEASGNRGYIKLNNGYQVEVLQLHKGNVGTQKFTNNVQVATIQKYMGVNLAGAQIQDGVEIDLDIERLNTYIFNEMKEAVCIYKTVDGIYIVRWTGSEYGDGEHLKSLISLTA